MDAKDSGQTSGAPADPQQAQPHSTAQSNIGRPTSNDASMTDPKRNAGYDDDEEEEGMLKVDEEGQIEDDGADVQVSHPRPSTDGRPGSLADRLMPLSDASSKKTGGGGPSGATNNGYVSPRHANLERERDRDRYLETSPGPSSYAPQRSRFGYPAESGPAYSSASSYPYPPNHREPLRADSYASGSRTPVARAENRRGWYPPPATARGPDTYRPGAIRDRERERERDRDWDSFREGDRDREWSALDRDRGDRDAYRDMADKRREWPPRERGAAASSYEAGDSHPPYPTSASGKYGFDSREYPGRRPASPPAHLGREREFDADRSRDRDRDRANDRDPRIRAPSSGWGSGMRQWGKPSDAGWDSRSGRRPASEDARSDTSHRQSGSRSNNTPPPAAFSETSAKPAGSDQTSERGEARSRDLSPHSARSPNYDDGPSKAADDASTKPKTVKNEANDQEQKPAESAPVEQQVVKRETEEEQHTQPPTAETEANGAEGADTSAPMEVDTAEEVKPESAPAKPATDVPALSEQAHANDAPPVDQSVSSEQPNPAAHDSAPPLVSLPAEQENADGSSARDQSGTQPSPAPEPATQSAASPATVKTEPSSDPVASLPAPSNEEGEEGQVETSAATQLPSMADDVKSQKEAVSEAAASRQDPAPQPENVEKTVSEGAEEGETASSSLPTGTSTATEQAGSSERPDDSAETEPEKATQPTNVAEEPTAEVALERPSVPASAVVQSEATLEEPATGAKPLATVDATESGEGEPAAPKATPPEAAIVPPSDASKLVSELPVEAPVLESAKTNQDSIADVDMPDAVPQIEQASQTSAALNHHEPPTGTSATIDTDERVPSPQEPGSLAASAPSQTEEVPQPAPTAVDAAAITKTEQVETKTGADDAEVTVKPPQSEQQEAAQPEVLAIPPTAAEMKEAVESRASAGDEAAIEQARSAAAEPEVPATEATVQMEEDSPSSSKDPLKMDAPAESKLLDESMESQQTDVQLEQPPVASVAETATAAVPSSEPAVAEPVTSEIQVSGPYVTATINQEKQTQEITLPHVDYGDDKEARALVRQENARIEEVEMPAADQTGPSLRIAEMDDSTREVEPPLMTPTTKEQVDRAILSAVREHIVKRSDAQNDWKKILRSNQHLALKTTFDVLHAKIHGIPQIVSCDQPLWLEDDDKHTERVKAKLYDQLLDRKKRLNDKIESLKKQYRSINEDWKVHCSRLDRAAERREMLRRPPVNTPAGTPGGFGVEDPSSGAAGGGLLGSSLTTGRANRRSAQAGFAGFGDAVRSEAEFLEILASLENADMQDPNMRAARTTATAPDMHIDPDSDRLMKLRYDDINGYVADPLAFYLDEFDPDVWSEEEKAIFARRYALWPKQFGKIAQALPHKTPAQCVRYYYLNKKVPGNDFKALAAARNRERKRKARVKPKKAKGSALMADLKSAKGEEVEDVEDGSGIRSPMDATDPSLALADPPVASNGRRGGRGRMVPAAVDSPHGEEVAVGRKRPADQTESEVNSGEAKSSDKRRSGPKSKRAKSDSASASEKARKPRTSLKKESAALEEAKAGVPPVPTACSGPKLEVTEASAPVSKVPTLDAVATATEAKPRVEDSDLAAAEALGALAGLFGGPGAGDAGAPPALTVPSSQGPAGSDAASPQHLSNELDADGRKAGKKRRSKTAVLGEEGAETTGKGRGKQPTSSYWSVAERSEFLRALVVHGPRWEVVSSTLAQKSAAQARNYFARNENEVDFAEAAALARSHADLPLPEREAAALSFVRQRFASNATAGGPQLPSGGAGLPTSVMSAAGFGIDAGPRTTHLPPPPGLTASQAEMVDVKMRDESPEPPIQRRGLQINSLLNDTNDAAISRAKRRSSLHEWQAERPEAAHPTMGRDASVPPALYARQAHELDRRPLTADRIEAARPGSSDGRSMREDPNERLRTYDRVESQRPTTEGRDLRDEAVDSRPWMYDSPYEAHRRPSPSPGYAPMAPPSHPAERGMPASRYSMPPGSVSGAGHMARPVPPMSSHLHPNEDVDGERERSAYGGYGGPGRPREHESHSMPPTVPGELRSTGSGEQLSPTSAGFGASHGYSRYAPPGVASLYPNTAAASTALAARGRPTSGPLTAPLPSTSERPAYEQRWQRYSQSPGPSTSSTPSAGASHGASGVGGYSTGSAYRSANSSYSSFPSQSLPRPSLPSLSAGGGKVGAPHLPSLGAAGRSLPPILGSFPAPGRGMGAGSRPAGTGEEARYWPYPHRPRGHDQPPNRTPE